MADNDNEYELPVPFIWACAGLGTLIVWTFFAAAVVMIHSTLSGG